MTRDDIIRMAREAKLPMAWITESGVISWPQLERFAALVAAAEREACARVCMYMHSLPDLANAWDCAAAIRARSEA